MDNVKEIVIDEYAAQFWFSNFKSRKEVDEKKFIKKLMSVVDKNATLEGVEKEKSEIFFTTEDEVTDKSKFLSILPRLLSKCF